jgi:hypothetical protein
VKSRHCLPGLKGKFQFAIIDEFDADLPTLAAVDLTNFGPGIDGCGSSSWGQITLRRWGFGVDGGVTIINAALLVLVAVEQDNVVSIN